ncbi:MAG: hydantoinase/oxoprolinase family protein [Thermodesulfobacteriota bacterium]
MTKQNAPIKATIDVDIGGTFTDCFGLYGDKRVFAKTSTTGYDLSVGFMRAVREVAASLNLSLDELVSNTEIIRYSTTIAMNTLLQRKGPRLGLICTEGFEDVVPIGKGSSWADFRTTMGELRNIARIEKPEPLIGRDMTVGVKERIDVVGRVVRPLDEEDFLERLRLLVDKGARGFVVSLMSSFVNPVHELRIREIIEREYPDRYLGAMPVVLSSEICPKRLEYTRTVTTALNAYLHGSMWDQLSGMGDELRDLGYQKGLIMVHNSGGMAEMYRTSAIQTFNGGPVAGLIGGQYLGQALGWDNVVISDMGGTSFDIGTVVAGSTRFYEFKPVIDRWWVDASMLETKSIGAGGGSIAWINELVGKRLEVGPQGAGSMPGPAAYDLGGTEPTVTDADVVLGYINPDYYHGGRMKLNAKKAAASIREKIADPLGMDVVEAAALIRKLVDAKMGDIIAKETLLRGYDPRNFVLLAFGGAGPTHCCGYGGYAGMSRIVAPPFSPVFCAFGSSTMDIVHLYEQSARIPLLAPMTMAPFDGYDSFNRIVAELKEKAVQDFSGEGFPAEAIEHNLDLEMKYGGQLSPLRISSPRLAIASEDDVRAIYATFESEYKEFYSPYAVYPQGGVDVFNLILRATVPRPKPALPVYPVKGPTPSKEALKGSRDVYWEDCRGFLQTPIYDAGPLEAGNVIEGPAVIEAESTTTVLPIDWTMTVDQHLNLVMEKSEGR